MGNLDSLYSVASLLTLQGAAAASLLVPNVLGMLIGETFDRYRKWTSFGVALVLAFVAAGLADEASWVKWVVAVFNGFLVFAAAMGVNQLPARHRQAVPDGSRFFRSWT